MTETVIARRYAGALFSLGRKQGSDALEKHGQCLAELAALIQEQPRLGAVLKSPVVSPAEKKAVLKSVLDLLDADTTMRNFCYLLADKERLGVLKDIAGWYSILLDETRGILRGKVITAVRLTPEKQSHVRESLRSKTGKDMELVFSTDPEILGGMILAIGDRVLDSSLRAQLGMLRENLKKGL